MLIWYSLIKIPHCHLFIIRPSLNGYWLQKAEFIWQKSGFMDTIYILWTLGPFMMVDLWALILTLCGKLEVRTTPDLSWQNLLAHPSHHNTSDTHTNSTCLGGKPSHRMTLSPQLNVSYINWKKVHRNMIITLLFALPGTPGRTFVFAFAKYLSSWLIGHISAISKTMGHLQEGHTSKHTLHQLSLNLAPTLFC